jgi:hypothetical protein
MAEVQIRSREDILLLTLADWLVWRVPEHWVAPEMRPPAPPRGRASKARLKAWRQAEQRWQKNQETLRRWLREYGEAAIRQQFPGDPVHHFTSDLCYIAPVGGSRYYRTSGKLDGTSGADPRLLSSWEWDSFAPQARWPIGGFGVDADVQILNARDLGKRSSVYCTLVDRTTKWGNRFEMAGDESKRDEVIQQYRDDIVKQPALMAALEELRGKHLICWCAPKRCHAEVLFELLYNRPYRRTEE